MVANIDIAPTLLEAAGLDAPVRARWTEPAADRAPATPRAGGARLLYEYFWERNFPQTPTIHALRGERYKYIRYQGIWDTDELYDLEADPHELRNLIRDPAHQERVEEMNARLFRVLEETGGLDIPLRPDRGPRLVWRRDGGSRAADFPAASYVRE